MRICHTKIKAAYFPLAFQTNGRTDKVIYRVASLLKINFLTYYLKIQIKKVYNIKTKKPTNWIDLKLKYLIKQKTKRKQKQF